MPHDDYAYFRRRAAQEEEATLNAAGPDARERHAELAAAYRLRCNLMKEPAGKRAESRGEVDALSRLDADPSLRQFPARTAAQQRAPVASPTAYVQIEQYA